MRHSKPVRLKYFSKQMRHNQTDAEAILWAQLRGRKLGSLKFKRQEIIGNYIVDFVCYDKKLIIEADGGQHGDNTYDKKRDTWLAKQDFTVLRFWNSEILASLDNVCLQILKAAGEAEADQWL